MEIIYGKGIWIDSTVRHLTLDEDIRRIFREVLMRTIGEAADDINFPYDRYSAPDGIGRPEKARLIGHWLCLESRIGGDLFAQPTMSSFLSEAGLDEIWRHARSRLAETGFDKSLPVVEGDEETVLEYEDGHRLVSIQRPEAIRNECHFSRMQGAVGDGMSSWVLRDSDGSSVAMLVIKNGLIVAMHGSGGRRVPFHVTEAYLLALVQEHGLGLAEPTTIHGAAMTSGGRIHDLRDIPDGSTIDGDLWIRHEGHLLARLPDDLTVNGFFGLFKGTYLRATPKNLVVAKDAGFVDCSGLKTISSGLKVGGWSHFETCQNIERIEEGVDLGRGVMLSAGITRLAADPFRVDEIVVRGDGVNAVVEGTAVPRDAGGLAVIDDDFVRATVRNEFRKAAAQLPATLVRVAYDSVKTGIRRGSRALRKAGDQNEGCDDGPTPKR